MSIFRSVAILAFLFCAVVISGCAENSKTIAKSSIVGKWDAAHLVPGEWEFKADGTGKNVTGRFEWKMEEKSICSIDMIGTRFHYRVEFENDKLLLIPTMKGKEGHPIILKRK